MEPEAHPMIRWAAQALPDRGRRYRAPGAVVVTGTRLNRRDRVVVAGEPGAAQPLVDAARADVPDHVVLGESALVRQLAGVEPLADFGWMDLLPDDPAPPVDHAGVRWLDDAEVAPVLTVASPDPWVRPGDPAVQAWAGAPPVRGGAPVTAEHSGGVATHPVAVGALAHCAPDVAFLAGVATLPGHRGQGLSTVVCAFLRDHGRSTHGTVALMVDGRNTTAIGVYTRLGFTYRSVTAARMVR